MFFLSLKKKIEDYQQIEFHKEIADKQRTMYNKLCNSKEFLKDNLLIDMDFKERIKIGKFFCIILLNIRMKYGASVECEPWFTGSREKCELDKNVNHKIFFSKIKESVNQIM